MFRDFIGPFVGRRVFPQVLLTTEPRKHLLRVDPPIQDQLRRMNFIAKQSQTAFASKEKSWPKCGQKRLQ